MPMFDFKCSDCGHEIADIIIRNFNDNVFCEFCGSNMTKKPFVTRFKLGNGFWEKNGYSNEKCNRKQKVARSETD